jgi:hypothetical protein
MKSGLVSTFPARRFLGGFWLPSLLDVGGKALFTPDKVFMELPEVGKCPGGKGAVQIASYGDSWYQRVANEVSYWRRADRRESDLPGIGEGVEPARIRWR